MLLRDRRSFFLLLVLSYLLYASLYIARTSFSVDGERYFCLLDDAMISMRYAKNLAHGLGPVWNAGEHVEGYTNPLWMLYMAALHLLPLADSKLSLPVQATGALLLALNLWVVRDLSRRLSGGSELVAGAAVFLTAFYLPLNFWSLFGMEVGAMTLVVTVATRIALGELETRVASPWLYPVLGIATLLRPDGVVPYAAILAFLVLFGPDRRRQMLVGLTVLGVALGAQTAFRWWEYRAVLPNTYYLKLGGASLALRVANGLIALRNLLARAGFVPFLAPFLLFLLRRDRRDALLAWVIAAETSYSVLVGGDAWEAQGGANRFLCPAIPLLFVLLALMLWTASRAIEERMTERRAHVRRALNALVVSLVVTASIQLNTLNGPADLREWLLLERSGWVSSHRTMVETARLLRSFTEPDARCAVVWAGIIPYFSDRPSIDLLGKSDARVARGPLRFDGGWAPGHMKWDYDYSIGVLEPDVLVQIWRSLESIRPLVEERYETVPMEGRFLFRLRRGSPRVRWPVVEALRSAP